MRSVGVGDGSGGGICEEDEGIDSVRSRFAGRPRREVDEVPDAGWAAGGVLRFADKRTLVRSSKA